MLIGHGGELRLDRIGDQLVNPQAIAPQQQMVGRVAQQRVAEFDRFAERAVPLHENAGPDQAIDAGAHLGFAEGRHRDQEFEGDVAADGGGELRGFAAVFEQVEPRQQCFVQGRRDRIRIGASGRDVLDRLIAARQLLGEDRNAVRARNDGIDDSGRHFPVGGDRVHQPAYLIGLQAREMQQIGVAFSGPVRRLAGTHGRHQQHRQFADQPRQSRHQFGRGRVDPVHVLDDDDRTFPADRLDDVEQRLHRARADFGRREPLQQFAIAVLVAQHFRDQRQPFGGRLADAPQQRVELLELAAVRRGDVGRVGEIVRDGMKRLVGVDRRALQDEPLRGVDLEPAIHLLDQARLAHPGIAGDDDDLPLSGLRGGGAIDQPGDFAFTADHRQAVRAMVGREPARAPAFTEHAKHRDGLRETLERPRAQILAVKLGADDPGGLLRDQDLARQRFRLQARGEVRRLAHQ